MISIQARYSLFRSASFARNITSHLEMHHLFVRLSTRYKINIMFFLTHQKYARIEKEQRKIRDDQLKIETKRKANIIQYEESMRLRLKKTKKTRAIEIVNETLKFEVFVNDIDFFDFTLQFDMLELHLSTSNANFLQQLKNSTIKYKKKSIVSLLNKCFRDFVYK